MSKKGGIMSKRETYEKYLQSNHWKGLRLKVFKVYGRKCFYHQDRVEGIHVHHMKYREFLEDCTERDCVPLCQECHTEAHSKQKELDRVKMDVGIFWASLKKKRKGKSFQRKKKPKQKYEKCKQGEKEVMDRCERFKATNKTRGPEKKEKWFLVYDGQRM